MPLSLCAEHGTNLAGAKGFGNSFFAGRVRLDCCYVEQMKTEYGTDIPEWKK